MNDEVKETIYSMIITSAKFRDINNEDCNTDWCVSRLSYFIDKLDGLISFTKE